MPTIDFTAAHAQRRFEMADRQRDIAERRKEKAFDVVMTMLDTDDGVGFAHLMDAFHCHATNDDLKLLDAVIMRALSLVKEREDSPAASLYDRLVEVAAKAVE